MPDLEELLTQESIDGITERAVMLSHEGIAIGDLLDPYVLKASTYGMFELDDFISRAPLRKRLAPIARRLASDYSLRHDDALDSDVLIRILNLDKHIYYDFENRKDKRRKFSPEKSRLSHVIGVSLIADRLAGDFGSPFMSYLSLLHDTIEDLPEFKEKYRSQINQLRKETREGMGRLPSMYLALIDKAQRQLGQMEQEYISERDRIINIVVGYLDLGDDILERQLSDGLKAITRSPFESYVEYIQRMLSVKDTVVRDVVVSVKFADRIHNTEREYTFDFTRDTKPEDIDTLKYVLVDRTEGKRETHYRNWALQNETVEMIAEGPRAPMLFGMRMALAQAIINDTERVVDRISDDDELQGLAEKIMKYSQLRGEKPRKISSDMLWKQLSKVYEGALSYDRKGMFQKRDRSPGIAVSWFEKRMNKEYHFKDTIGRLSSQVDPSNPVADTGYRGLVSLDSVEQFYAEMLSFNALAKASQSKNMRGGYVPDSRALIRLPYSAPGIRIPLLTALS